MGRHLGEVRPLPEALNDDRQPREQDRVGSRTAGRIGAAGKVCGVDAVPVDRHLWEESTDVAPLLAGSPAKMRAAEVADGPGAVLTPSHGEDGSRCLRRRGHLLSAERHDGTGGDSAGGKGGIPPFRR